MKIQCDVCQRAEATVLCCADEAALCWQCDEQVHAANKLASKHQRVPLLPDSSQHPTCDICQEKAGHFFCLEDRALLCRDCDVAVHTASPYVSCHQRFLLTGTRIALQHYLSSHNSSNISISSSNNTTSSHGNSSEPSSSPAMTNYLTANENPSPWEGEGSMPQWPWNEFFEDTNLEQCYGVSDPGSSSSAPNGI